MDCVGKLSVIEWSLALGVCPLGFLPVGLRFDGLCILYSFRSPYMGHDFQGWQKFPILSRRNLMNDVEKILARDVLIIANVHSWTGHHNSAP